MRYWVVGARGMLGQAVVRALGGKEYLATGREEADLVNLESLRRCASRFRPDVILNCAAYTAVDAAEDDQVMAMTINRDGVRNLAHVAHENDCRLVHVSTDYVFDGQARFPYRENTSCSPQGVYGTTKLAGEKAIQEVLQGRGVILRTSWLFGPGGNNFVRTMVRLMLSRPQIGVVNDQRGRPTFTEDLARCMAVVSASEVEGGVYHFANKEEVSWFEFAQAIKDLVGENSFCREIASLQTHEYPTRAPRPTYSVLDTTKISSLMEPRSWREPLKDYVENLVQEMKESYQ